MSNTICGALALATLSLLCACATPSSGQIYSRNEARTAWTVVQGRVSDVKPVQIEGNKSVLGTAGGGYVGYELGRSAVSQGLSILDLVQVHHEVLLEVLEDSRGDDLAPVATAASEFLLEVLATYDMAQRSFLRQP